MYKDINFNENEPSPNNIDYVFSKILFCLTSASLYNEYKILEKDIKIELNKFVGLFKTYINEKNLLCIPFEELDKIAIKVSSLDYETVTKDGMYLEMTDVWLSILIGYYKKLEKDGIYGKR